MRSNVIKPMRTIQMICAIAAILCLLTGTAIGGTPVRGQLLDGNGAALDQKICAGLTALVEGQLASGNNVSMTIDAGLQKAAQNALTEVLGTKMPGTVVVMDGQGRVLALADNQGEKGVPLALATRATPGRTLTPVTTLAALRMGVLSPDEIINDEGYFLEYTTDMSTAPKCWIAEKQRFLHQYQTVVQAFGNSCDYFFYTLGSRIGPEGLVRMEKDLGLDSLSGLGIPGEVTGILACQNTLFDPDLPLDEQYTGYPAQVRTALIQHLGQMMKKDGQSASEEMLALCADALMRMAVENNQADWVVLIREVTRRQLDISEDTLMTQAFIGTIYEQLNLIKWSGNQTLEAAMGRSFTRVTPIAMARYWAAMVSGGHVMNSRLVESVTGANGEKICETGSPEQRKDLTGELGEYIGYVKKGLAGVVDVTGKAAKAFRNQSHREVYYDMSSILSTKESKKPDISQGTWMAGMFPLEKPQISVVVFITGSGENEAAATIFRKVAEQYLAQLGV